MKHHFQYGFFAFPAAISLLMMQVYIPSYIAESGAFSLTAIGMVFFLARLFDTGSDLFVGYLSDLTPYRSWKRRIWVLLGTPFFLWVFWLLIQGPETILVLLLLSTLWYLTGTCLIIPYYTLGAEVERGYYAHNRFVAARVLFGLLGTLTALTAPALLIPEGTVANILELNYKLTAIGFIIGLFLLSKLPKENHSVGEILSVRRAFGIFKKGSDFNKLIFSQLLNGTANALPATLFILFTTHILKQPTLAAPLLLIYFVSAAISVPVWVKCATYFPKEKCWGAAMVIASLVFIGVLWVDNSTLWLFIVITFITGLMAGADLSLPASMLADLVDKDESENQTRRGGVYFAIWGTTSKLTLAIAIGLAFPLLDTGQTAQASEYINSDRLVLLYALLPACLKLISVWMIRGYKLNIQTYNSIVKARGR